MKRYCDRLTQLNFKLNDVTVITVTVMVRAGAAMIMIEQQRSR